VTGLVDSEQVALFKSSMYEKAKQIGLPASFIDIRHDAIHGDLPSLMVLRTVAQKALHWLWNDYWKYLDVEAGTTDEAETAAFVHQRESLKEQFRTIFEAHLSAAPTISSASPPQDPSRANEPTNTCLRLVLACKGNRGPLTEMIKFLLEDGMLIPPRPQVVPLPHVIPNIDRPRLSYTMDGLFSSWDGLLKQLTFHQAEFLILLTEALAMRLISPFLMEPKIDTYREAVTSWLIHIYVSKEWSAARKRGKVNPQALLSTCLQNPNTWTSRIASAIVSEPCHKSTKDIFGARVAALAMEQAALEASASPRIPAEDLDNVLASYATWLETTDVRNPRPHEGGWQKMEGRWTSKPFGTI
jgi:ribosomal biogenesis protein LAS1